MKSATWVLLPVGILVLAVALLLADIPREDQPTLIDAGTITKISAPICLYKNGWAEPLNERRAVTIDERANYNIASVRCTRTRWEYCEIWKDASAELYLK